MKVIAVSASFSRSPREIIAESGLGGYSQTREIA